MGDPTWGGDQKYDRKLSVRAAEEEKNMKRFFVKFLRPIADRTHGDRKILLINNLLAQITLFIC